MKTHHLFAKTLLAGLMLGGGICQPLYAQEAPAASAACADDFAAAAYLPANSESFGVLNTAALMELAHKAGLPQAAIPAEIAAIDSVAIGIPNDWTNGIDAYMAICELALQTAITDLVLPDWATKANKNVANIISNARPDYQQAADTILNWADTPSAPAYAIIHIKPGQEAQLTRLCEKLDTLCQQLQLTEKAVTAYQSNGWEGLHIKFDTAAIAIFPKNVEEALQKLNIYLVYRVENNALMMSVCQDPAQLQLGNGTTHSVLSSPQADFMRHMEPHRALLAGSVNPAILNSLHRCITRVPGSMAAPIQQIFNNIAEQCPEVRTEMKSGLTSIQQILAELSKLTPQVNSPFTFCAWHDGNLHFTAQGDACGESFSTATVNTAGTDTAGIYLYGSTLHSPNLPDLDTLVYCGFDVTNTIAYTLPTEAQQELIIQLGTSKMIYAMLPGMLAPVGQMVDALGNGWCYTMTADPQGMPDHAFRININDATKLSLGWAGTKQNAALLCSMMTFFDNEEVLDIFESYREQDISAAQDGTAMLYTHILCPGGGMACTNTQLVLATNAQQAADAALHPRTEELCGIKMGFRLEQLLLDRHPKNRRTTTEADVQAIIRNTIRQHVLSIITGGTLFLTTENGKMKLQIDLTTPGLQ